MKSVFTRVLFLCFSVIIVIFIYNLLTDANQENNLFNNLFEGEYASKYIYVYDRESEDVFYEKAANKKIYPASLVKMMTVLVALEEIDDLGAIAPIDKTSYHKLFAENASMAGFVSGENVTYRDLLYGTMLASGGEAANSLAIHVAGGTDAFVGLMNEKAAEIGLKKTVYTNVEGLHDVNQVTTAADQARLLDYALDNGDFKAIFTKRTFTTTQTVDHPDGIRLASTVLSQLPEDTYVTGGKSGTTKESGASWITTADVGGKSYILVVMGAPLKDLKNNEMKQKHDTLKLINQLDN